MTTTVEHPAGRRLRVLSQQAYEARGVPDQTIAETWPYLLEEVGELGEALQAMFGDGGRRRLSDEIADVAVVTDHILAGTYPGGPLWVPGPAPRDADGEDLDGLYRYVVRHAGYLARWTRRDKPYQAVVAACGLLNLLAVIAVGSAAAPALLAAVERKVSHDLVALGGPATSDGGRG